MPDQPKITFQLTARDERRLEIRVAAPGGETHGETSLPDPAILDDLSATQETGKLPGGLVEKTGKALYAALVSESVDELVIDTLNDAIRASLPLQFELRFDPDQIALTRYPWEMIQNAQGQYLIRDGLVDLTRYVTYPQPPPVFDDSIKGLPLFRVVSTPAKLPPLTSGALAITPIDTLEHASFEAFMRKLLIERLKLWGLHFDGHGALALQCANCETLNGPADGECWSCHKPLADAKKVGALAFEKGGDVAWVPTGEFGSVLYNAHARLALLLACETARVGNQIVFSGLAPGLLLAGVPAVIGMQFPILDSFANRFANEFYAALVRDNDLLAALRIARRMNLLDAWYSPALYLRRQPTPAEVAKQAIYLARNIDTAVPARVAAGASFLTRLWIRRPETKPLTAAKLRNELDIPKDVPVRQAKGEAEVKFEPVAGRQLRRGEVDVKLSAKDWEVIPDAIKLFIDETLDAPPAIFTVKAKTVGKQPLIFSVMQDGGVIHIVTHVVESVDEQKAAAALPEVAEHSQAVNLEDDRKAAVAVGAPPGAGVPKTEPPASPDTPADRAAIRRAIDKLESAKPEMPPSAEPVPPPPPRPAPTDAPQPATQAGEAGPPADLLSDETSPSERTLGGYQADETQIGKKRDHSPVAVPPGGYAAELPPPPEEKPLTDDQETTRASDTTREQVNPYQRQSGQQRYDSQAAQPAAPMVTTAPVSAPKGGLPLLPILIVGGLGIAAIVIGAILIFNGLFGGGLTPTPTPTGTPTDTPTAVPTTATPLLPPPAVIAPNGDRISCQQQVVFRWQEAPDPSLVSSYQIEVEMQQAGAWQTVLSSEFPRSDVAEALSCPDPLTRYEWRVRARSTSGQFGEWSDWAQFYLIAPPTETPTPTPTLTPTPAPPTIASAYFNPAPPLPYGWDYTGLCTKVYVTIESSVTDPEGLKDVSVLAIVQFVDDKGTLYGAEQPYSMKLGSNGRYTVTFDLPQAAVLAKFSTNSSGEIRVYVSARDPEGVSRFPINPAEWLTAPIYYCIP